MIPMEMPKPIRVPFVDLKAQYASIAPEIGKAIDEVLTSCHFILGPKVEAFETEFAQAHDAPYSVAVNNGTSALHIALWALGVGPGHEVIVPVNTFAASAEAVVLCGAIPVFIDHDEYFNLDPKKLEETITPRTKAIIPVHLYGQLARMDEIAAIARHHNLVIVEDAAQAHISQFDGRFAGSWGEAACFSFYPGKNLGAYGEAGAVLTNDASLHRAMRELRDHGSETKYVHRVSGHNYRMEAIQGAVLEVKLRYLDKWTEQRRAHAAQYSALLADIHGIELPIVHPKANPVWHLYVTLAEHRDGLKDFLEERGVMTGMHYPVPLHMQPAFSSLKSEVAGYPNAERNHSRLLSLPMYPELEESQIEYVASCIREFYKT